MRKCRTCGHVDVELINAAMVSGISYRNISERWELPLGSLHRHAHLHLPRELVASAEGRRLAAAGRLSERVRSLLETTGRMMAVSEAKASASAFWRQENVYRRTAVLAARETTRLVELLGRAEGELVQRVELTTNPEWIELRRQILAAVEDHPDVRFRLVEVLKDGEVAGRPA